MYEKVRSASPNWFNLGLALKLSYTDLTNFRETYRGDNDVCLREVLALRLQSGTLTWGDVCTALRHSTVKRNDVAVEIEKVFIESKWLHCIQCNSMHSVVGSLSDWIRFTGFVIPDTVQGARIQ